MLYDVIFPPLIVVPLIFTSFAAPHGDIYPNVALDAVIFPTIVRFVPSQFRF